MKLFVALEVDAPDIMEYATSVFEQNDKVAA
jgi:hypothetical protein